MIGHGVTVMLIVKADTPDEAVALANDRLHDLLAAWFAEDIGKDSPFPKGSLLFFQVRKAAS